METSPLKALREQTADLHDRLEAGKLPLMLMAKQPGQEVYAAFLRANYRVFAALEPAISRHIPQSGESGLVFDKSRALVEDLLKLDPDAPPPETLPDEETKFVDSGPAAWGAAYVLEGSALGGKVILKHMKTLPEIAAREAFAYLSGDEAGPPRWPAFKRELERRVVSERAAAEAVAAARETFLLMEKAFDAEAARLAL